MADYWIKYFIEILDDPKMATLPDRLWRRVSELFLAAGKVRKDGWLPCTRQIAWILRLTDVDELERELNQISEIGIIKRVEDGWVVVNYAKRQAPSTAKERKQAQRDRERSRQYNGECHADVTNRDNGVRQNQITESEQITEQITEPETTTTGDSSDGCDAEFSVLVRHYEQNIGVITPQTSDMIIDDLKQFGLTNCMDAIGEAVRQNIRKWSYVQGILRKWKTDGRGNLNGNIPPRPPATDQRRAGVNDFRQRHGVGGTN